MPAGPSCSKNAACGFTARHQRRDDVDHAPAELAYASACSDQLAASPARRKPSGNCSYAGPARPRPGFRGAGRRRRDDRQNERREPLAHGNHRAHSHDNSDFDRGGKRHLSTNERLVNVHEHRILGGGPGRVALKGPVECAILSDRSTERPMAVTATKRGVAQLG